MTAVVRGAAAAPQPRVLVYTRNQIGPNLFVHDNIPASVAAIKKLGQENHFDVEVSDDPGAFTDANLKQFQVIVFDNSNNEILDTEAQKAALQHFVRAGGGIVGIHSACGSMRQWPWFWKMMGGKFARHARIQPFTVKNMDPKNISTAHLPASFEWTDEFYYLDQMPDDLHVLLAGDLAGLKDSQKEKSRNPKVRPGCSAGLVPPVRRRPRMVHDAGTSKGALQRSNVCKIAPGRYSLGDGKHKLRQRGA